MAAPFDLDSSGRVVVDEIIFRYVDIESLRDVTLVFFIERILVVFGMTHHVYLAAVHRGNDVVAGFIGIGQDLQ